MKMEVISMAITTKEQLLKVLRAFNPWWTTGAVHPSFLKEYRRFAYYEAMNRLEQKDIRRTVVLTGTRRVGKTTIEYQMIDTLIERGVSPAQIVFISLDHPMLKLSNLSDILDCYHENVWPTQDVYYFFDEVQYANSWDKWLKTIYDTQPDTKCVATGSASPALIRGGAESGVGRWSVIQVPTLSFYEYCALIGVKIPDLDPEIRPTSFLRMTKQRRTQVMMKLAPLQNHFNRYLTVGGFPELALASNDVMARQIMREDVVDKALKRDLPALYSIRSPLELERIFLYLCNVSSDIVSFTAISKELDGVSRATVENYVKYLESANLIYQSWPVVIGGRKALKVQPKIYVADAAIRNAVLMDDDLLTDPIELGKVVETTIYKHVASFYYQMATRIGYSRGGPKNKEVDIVVDYPNIKNILIEVKYREQAPIADNDAIVELSKEASVAIIVTKRADDYGSHHTPDGRELIRIPAFAFLYLLGNAERHGYRGKE